MLKKFVIKKNERGVLLRDGDFERILDAGRHYLFDPLHSLSVQPWRLDTAMTDMDLVDYLRSNAPEIAENYFDCWELSEDEAGLRYEHNVLAEILPPGSRRAYWKGWSARRLDKVDLRQDYTLPSELVMHLPPPNQSGVRIAGMQGILLALVPAYQTAVLKVDGKVERLLKPGFYGFWRYCHDVQVEIVDTRLQTLEVTGQEILTRDKVGLRLNFAATWRYSDILLAFEKLAKPWEHLYRELQFGLRAAVGTRTLDQLLDNKQLIDADVKAYIEQHLAGFGIEVNGLGVKDIVLPGEMKTILAQVVEAQKAAEANVIKRREETNATRSLLNTAKVMEENPVALRMKELETLERVAERIDRISVFGGLEQVLDGLVKFKTG